MSGSSYTADDFATNYPVGMVNYYWTYARNKILLRELKKHGFSGKKILEIGCATGLVVSYLRENGLAIWGVELGDPDVLPGAKEFVYKKQDCLDLPADFRTSVDVVMLLDVIEHIEDPIPFLQAIVASYPNAQHIVISVPSRSELWSSYDVEYRHYRRYDLGQIRDTVAAIPYEIQSIAYLFKSLYPPAWIAAKTSGKRNHIVRPPLTKMMIFIHRCLSMVLYLDYLILPGRWVGSSILTVFRKKGNSDR